MRENLGEHPVEPESLHWISGVGATFEFSIYDIARRGELGMSLVSASESMRRHGQNRTRGCGARSIGSGIVQTAPTPFRGFRVVSFAVRIKRKRDRAPCRG